MISVVKTEMMYDGEPNDDDEYSTAADSDTEAGMALW